MIINANALQIPLKSKSVQCAITSPPYWGLRDYGEDNQLGLEKTPEEYVANMVNVFREVWRVLKDDGVLWLNLGDTYAGNYAGNKNGNTETIKNVRAVTNSFQKRKPDNLKTKDLVGIPWMVAFALRADGWYLRNDIIWWKPNQMPSSAKDRCTKAHEYIFLLTKNAIYYYDNEAIKEPKAQSTIADKRGNENGHRLDRGFPGSKSVGGTNLGGPEGKRNKRSVWTVNTKPYKGAHFATFPPDLIEPMVLAGSRKGDTVFDPFSGTSTVGQVAIKHKRKYAGTELSFDYIKLAKRRLTAVPVSLF